eukprot:5152074-Lingulodinium_polyedra.AAC.1
MPPVQERVKDKQSAQDIFRCVAKHPIHAGTQFVGGVPAWGFRFRPGQVGHLARHGLEPALQRGGQAR